MLHTLTLIVYIIVYNIKATTYVNPTCFSSSGENFSLLTILQSFFVASS